MEIELTCSGCRCRLRVPAEAAGREVECPQCGRRQIAAAGEPAQREGGRESIPAESQGDEKADDGIDSRPLPAPQLAPVPLVAEWFLKTPEGLTYGPVDVERLNAWVAEGRVSPDCQLRSETHPQWKGAEHYYPVLKLPPTRRLADPRRPPPVERDTSAAPGAPHRGPALRPADPAIRPLPIDPPLVSGPALFVAPHRGPLVLLAGILSWVACPLMGFVAWNMAAKDLAEMAERRMDPAGHWPTLAGYYLALGSLVVSGLLLVVGLLVGAAMWLMLGTR